jgi:hypothetical protein
LGGVLDGFQAVQGGLGLIGVEGQAVEEAMLKVQSAMALSQGIQGLMEAKDSFKQLGTVAMDALKGIRTGIAATGIGLLIVAVGLLVANFDKLKDAFSSALGKAKAFEKGVSEQAAAARDAVNNFGEYERTLRRLGKTQDEIEKKRRERFKQAIEDTEKELKANKKVYQEQLKNLESVRTADKYGFNFVGRLIYGDEEDAKAQRAKVKETRAQLEKLKNDKFEFEQKIKDDAKQKREEDLQDYKDKIKAKQDLINADLEKIRENNKVALEENQARLRTEQEQEEFLVNQKFDEQIKLAKKYRKDTTQLELDQANQINEIRLKYQEEDYKKKEEARQKELEAIKAANEKRIALEDQQFELQQSLNQTQKEKEIADLVKSYEDKFAIANGNAELEKQLTEQQKIDLGLIEDKYRKEKEAKDKEAAEKEIQTALAVQQQKAAIQQQGLDTALQGVQLIKTLFENQKGVQKAAVIAESAIGIAKMIISNKIANAGALASPANILVPGTAAPIIAMNNISTGIGIAANIAATAKALKTLGGGSAPSPSPLGGGGGAGGGGAMAPQFNTIGTSGINQLATLQQQPTKAYVVSGEVTSAQSLDRNRLQNATL